MLVGLVVAVLVGLVGPEPVSAGVEAVEAAAAAIDGAVAIVSDMAGGVVVERLETVR